MEGDGSWLNRFDESEGERGWEDGTAGTGPGGIEGRWGRNCCRAGRLGLGGKGWGGMLWGQDLAAGEENGARMRPVETGKVLGGVGGPGMGPGGAGRMLGGGRGKLVAGGEGELE